MTMDTKKFFDFTTETPGIYAEPLTELKLDRPAWTAIVREVSKIARDYLGGARSSPNRRMTGSNPPPAARFVVETCVVPEADQPTPFRARAVKVYFTGAPSGRLIGREKARTGPRPKPGLA